jgi:hypothetical protein
MQQTYCMSLQSFIHVSPAAEVYLSNAGPFQRPPIMYPTHAYALSIICCCTALLHSSTHSAVWCCRSRSPMLTCWCMGCARGPCKLQCSCCA